MLTKILSVEFLREFPAANTLPLPEQPSSSGRSTPLTPEQLRQLSWQQDPFIPQHMYNAMSENKRFDSMRVSGKSATILDGVNNQSHRVGDKRMPKNSLGSSLTLFMRNSSLCSRNWKPTHLLLL